MECSTIALTNFAGHHAASRFSSQRFSFLLRVIAVRERTY